MPPVPAGLWLTHSTKAGGHRRVQDMDTAAEDGQRNEN